MVSREEVELLLKTQREALIDSIGVIVSSLENRLSRVETELMQSKLELAQTIHENTVQKGVILQLKEELTGLKEKSPDTISSRIDYLEDQSRRNNLRFEGLPEDNPENWEQTAFKVQNLIKDKLGITENLQIERAHRVGKLGSQKPRSVVAKFLNFKDRNIILKNSAKLKGTNVFINEDLCEASNAIRRSKLPELKKARSEGKIAFFSHTKLIIRERRLEGETPVISNREHAGPATAGASGVFQPTRVTVATRAQQSASQQRSTSAPKPGTTSKTDSSAARNTRANVR